LVLKDEVSKLRQAAEFSEAADSKPSIDHTQKLENLNA
jgi:hypothetical protein